MDISKFNNDEAAEPEFEEDAEGGPYKKGNIIKVWGSKESMNLNSMILTNILQSPYYKNHLSELTTYHELVDEIYYRVRHLEPWEKGSRKVGGQTGMCGGVRGVGAGGIVSTPFCILYKLFTLKLTRSQLRGMIEHSDSAYIRALGFMYIRYAVHPDEFWAWFSIYLDDEEEVDAKAGGGCTISMGELVERLLTKLDWFSTLFPRIPVPIQKKIDERLREYRFQKIKNETDNKLISQMLNCKQDDGAPEIQDPVAEEQQQHNSSSAATTNNESETAAVHASKKSSRKDKTKSRSRSRSHKKSKKSKDSKKKDRRRSDSADKKHRHRHSRSKSREEASHRSSKSHKSHKKHKKYKRSDRSPSRDRGSRR